MSVDEAQARKLRAAADYQAERAGAAAAAMYHADGKVEKAARELRAAEDARTNAEKDWKQADEDAAHARQLVADAGLDYQPSSQGQAFDATVRTEGD